MDPSNFPPPSLLALLARGFSGRVSCQLGWGSSASNLVLGTGGVKSQFLEVIRDGEVERDRGKIDNQGDDPHLERNFGFKAARYIITKF